MMVKNIFKKIKARYLKYRILEIDGVFIPQVYSGYWEGIARDKDAFKNLWFTLDVQIDRCSSETFDEANVRLQDYLDSIETKKKQKEIKETEIIHLMQADPKAWRILKRK
jgi:bifunctional N-acetylglucosamine-1-phosphate-uridyltransferase/glucosamine-1-phosphate-acetyltransferase GlmU-like protein